MNATLMLATRNFKVYTRNRASVFFSFLSVILIIALYALFLGRVQVENVQSAVGDIPGIRFLIDSWIMAGLLSINAVTITLGALGTMVQDVEQNRFDDFLVAPISRGRVVLSYLFSSWLIGLLFSLVGLVACEGYIVASGGEWLTPLQFWKVIGLLLLDVVSSASLLYFILLFVRSMSAFGALSTILGTMIGFLTGVYVPLGILPDAMQRMVVFLPFSHSAAALRQVFCAPALATVFGGAPAAVLQEYERSNGIVLYWGGQVIPMGVMLGVLAATAVVFLLLSALRLRHVKQR